MNQRNTLANNPNTTSKNSVGKTPMKSVKKSQSMSVEVDDAGQGTSNAKMKKAINKYSRERNLPLTRVRRIMESSPSTDEQKLTGEAIHGMARATEAFIEMLARGAYTQAAQNRINYNDVSEFVHSSEELSFIQDILPRKQKYSEVLKMVKKNKS